MKCRNTLLVLILALMNSALAIEYTVERFDPPILFNAEGFKSEAPNRKWATAFLARRAPVAVTLEEFQASLSDVLREKYEMDESKFQAMVASTPEDSPYESVLVEVEFSQMGEDYLMLIVYPSELQQYPKSQSEADGFVAKMFFKQVAESSRT